MIRKTQARPYHYGRKPEPPPQQVESSAMKKAGHLEYPGPGVEVSVPIALAPEWLALHGLEPDGPQIPANKPAIVLVRRIKKPEQAEG